MSKTKGEMLALGIMCMTASLHMPDMPYIQGLLFVIGGFALQLFAGAK